MNPLIAYFKENGNMAPKVSAMSVLVYHVCTCACSLNTIVTTVNGANSRILLADIGRLGVFGLLAGDVCYSAVGMRGQKGAETVS